MHKINYKNLFNVRNKTVLIVGGSGLVGGELSNAFAQLGSKVIIADNNLDESKKIINKNPKKNISHLFIDLFNKEHLEKRFINILKKLKKVDIFINASYPATKDWAKNNFKEIKYDSLKTNIEYQLISYAWLSRCVANHMIKNKINGSIINFGSIYGVVGQNLNNYKKTKMKESLTYAIVKGGIINLTKLMASYYGKFNIRVNCISPGGLKGPVVGLSRKQDKNFLKQYSNNVPMKRIGSANEICGATIFLGSDASSYVTGINLLVDGGYTAI